jgi:hypothetical protein
MTFTQLLANVRSYMQVDSNQWSTDRITVSLNKALDKVIGYGIGADKRFRVDSANHTKMPIGTSNLVADQKQYSFLTDEQGNRILTLTRIEVKDEQGNWVKVQPIDMTQIDIALDEFEKTSGTPQYYDKVTDNVIRLYPASSYDSTDGIKYYFQRNPSYFETTDTTKETGLVPELDEYIVSCAALEGAVSLGLANLPGIKVIHDSAKEDMVQYFTRRSEDEQPYRIQGAVIDCV